MNIAEIRQKYPQYADISDRELVRGLHQKFYSDMPYAGFLKQIDFSERVDPTKDMSGVDKFNAGMGKAFTDIGRGAAQLVGSGPSGQEVRDQKSLDAPLMNTGSGMAGNIAGNVAALAPAALLPGAAAIPAAGALGATAGALQPTEGTGERLGNMAVGGALGAGVQGLTQYPTQIYEGVKTAIKKPFQTAHAVVEPFYEGGRKNIISRSIADAAGPNRQQVIANLKGAQELVPGSQPTAAEVANSGGIAALQRSASAIDPESYAARALQQNEARTSALTDMAGTGGQREFYGAARSQAANDLYSKAYDKGVDIRRNPATGAFLPKAEISGVKGEITKLLKRPAVSDAMEQARTLAANEGVNLSDPSGSVKGLDYLKRALDDKIGGSAGNEQRVLVELKNRLLTTIDRLSPDYAQARTTFAEMSKPINQMDIAQAISDKSINKLTGNIQPQQFARALSDDTAVSATGFGKATLENTMEPSQLGSLNAIKNDLARSVMARDLGRGAGSDTTQKLAMSNLMQRSGLPMGVLNTPGIGRFGNWMYQNADQQMRERLAKALLNPKEAATLLERTKPYVPMGEPSQITKQQAGQLARMLALPAAANQ